MGVIGLHMSGSALDVAACKAFTHQQLIQLFNLDSHVEADSGIPGVSMSKPVRLPHPGHVLFLCLAWAGQATCRDGCNTVLFRFVS